MKLDVINPATEAVVAQIEEADVAAVDRAVTEARAAFEQWRCVSVEQRQAALRRAARAVEAHVDELAELETSNTGILLRDARTRYAARTGAASILR
ncbi:MAG: aldehyde dehydrogenase family protein [Hyphomonadaceae bacterium]